jgi:hypothetical protein
MPIQTDLSVSPYFDDYNENRDYYKVLFRPGVAVQTRELNQLQTILQKQIERFGDNIFKRGTVVDGCDITFYTDYPYVKIKDNQNDGAPVNVAQFTGYYVRNEANVAPLVAAVQTVVDGFESRSPDLKTIYLRYVNSGFANVAGVETEQQTFAANQSLTVYDPDSVIEKITSFNDSSGFANTDSVVILSAIAIQNSTGGTTFTNSFYAQDYINDGTANVQVVAVDTTTNTEVVILRIKPRAIDLKSANSLLWTLSVNNNIQSTNATPSDVATIVDIVGSGATALLTTGSAGEVDRITVTAKGSGYTVLPTVSIASPGATTTQISQANLVPQTFLTKITVAPEDITTSPVGTGYAMSVGNGVIYQKGYFSRVNEHLVIVDKYSNTPDAIAVGFDTTEEIINSNQDTSLLDNATGQPNATAPGANRLKLTPTLVVKSKAAADANTNFLSIAEFSGGNPYKQNRQTVYNIIGNELARRSFEESGNFVLDPFLLNTKHANTISDEQNTFKISIDPGVAYVNGRRIETSAYYETSVDKGTDTFLANNVTVSMNYGNYVRVRELGGIFKFNLGDLVTLYPNAAQYITSGSAGTTPATGSLGTALGTARIRSLVYESGTPGTADCVYRLYLFDIQLATARNFKLIKSIYYNGTNKGVCDTVLEGGEAVLKDNNLSSLIFSAGRPAVKTGNNFSYIYRTINDSGDLKLAANGIITLAASGTETFPYTAGATLSTAQENEITVIPLANVEAAANIAGSVTASASSNQITGTSTSFTAALEAGDFIKIANTTSNAVFQVSRVANDTVLFLTTNAAAYTGANVKIYFPKNSPIPLIRTTRSANVDANANTLVITLGAAVNVQTDVAVAYNVRSSNTTPVVKTINRDRFVRLSLANNAAVETGPWVLGVPDIFRLGKVYKGPNATFVDTDTTNVTDVTSDFYIDHNQTEDYYGISYLYKRPNSTLALANTDFLLVKFDHFIDSGEGLKAPGVGGTYTINDGIDLASSAASVNTLEIPEVYSTKGVYYDLRDNFDFRPQSANTVVPNANSALAPINPVEPSNAARFTTADKKFPAPDSNLTGVVEYYNGRVDRVVIDEFNNFHIVKGTPGAKTAPTAPNNALTVNILNIPPYPSNPYVLSAQTAQFADTFMANEKFTTTRLQRYRVTTTVDATQRQSEQPRGYTMTDIGALERRINNLEYYVSFTLVETLTQKQSIPSSANAAIERAKFGFFVDSFDNYNLSDVSVPGYNAAIVDGCLSPQVEEINLPLESKVSVEALSLPYVEKTIISQNQATDGAIVPVGSGGSTDPITGTIVVTPVSNTTPTTNTVVQTTATIIQSEKTRARSDSGLVFEEFFYTFSSTAGQVRFFINSRDNNIAAEIFQSQTAGGPWISILTSATASAITTSDITTYSLSSLNGGRKIEHPGTLIRKSYGPVGRFLEDQFKLQWTHNPDGGVYYKIRIYKGSNRGGQGRSGTFGYKLFYPIDSTVNSTVFVNGLTPTVSYLNSYLGSFDYLTSNYIIPISYYGSWFPWTGGYYDITPTAATTAVSNEQSFLIKANGLRPNTTHTFFFDGQDQTSRCKQAGNTLGGGLRSDTNGSIEFTFYYYPDTQPISAVTAGVATAAMAAGVKAINLRNADGTSVAQGTLQIKQYAKEEIANTSPLTPSITAPALAERGGGGASGGLISDFSPYDFRLV